MTTLAEIGRAAGVSAATVSAVLNPNRQTTRVSPQVAERVRSLADSMGYAPNYAARTLRSGHAQAIAVTIATADDPVLEHPYHSVLLSGIESVIRHAGSEVVLVGPLMDNGNIGQSANDRTRAGLRAKRFDAAVLLCGEVEDLDLPGAQVVAIEHEVAHMPVVKFDEDLAVKLMIQHLADLGHHKVLWLGPASPPVSTASQGDRGRRCAVHARIRLMMVEDLRFTPTIDIIDDARATLRARLTRKRTFTAVLAYNDRIAIGAQQALYEAGLRIPHDVSVVGIDDIYAPLATPPLTSVNHRLRDMGRRAGEMALDLAAGRTLLERVQVIAPELVVRASTGPARS